MKIFSASAWAFAVLLAAASMASPARAASTPLAPDGTYNYDVKEGDVSIGGSVVTIKRTGNVVSLHEAQTLTKTQYGVIQSTADLALIAESLEPLSYSGSYLASGKITEVRFVMQNGMGAFSANGQRLIVPVRVLPGTQGMAVQEQLFALSFIPIPPLVQIARATSLTVADPTQALTHVMIVDPAPQAKPAGLPAADVGLGFASPVAYSIFYDPQTGVVDEVDIPSQSLVITRKR